jgi:hypothetical protein
MNDFLLYILKIYVQLMETLIIVIDIVKYTNNKKMLPQIKHSLMKLNHLYVF